MRDGLAEKRPLPDPVLTKSTTLSVMCPWNSVMMTSGSVTECDPGQQVRTG